MSLRAKGAFPKRIFRAGEYDHENSSPVPLFKALEPGGFEPVQLGRTPWPSSDDLDRITEKARRQGLEEGLREAQETIRREQALQRRMLEDMLEGLAKPYKDLNQELALELAEMAIEIGAALFGRALQDEPEQIAAIVIQAVSLLPAGGAPVSVVLHPDDLTLCSDLLQGEEPALSLQGDETMRRGGCLVRRGSSEVDAGVASRLSALLESIHGGALAGPVRNAAAKLRS